MEESRYLSYTSHICGLVLCRDSGHVLHLYAKPLPYRKTLVFHPLSYSDHFFASLSPAGHDFGSLPCSAQRRIVDDRTPDAAP